MAFVGGCYPDVFPALGLLGPASDPRFATPTPQLAASLPFSLPTGMGIITAFQSRFNSSSSSSSRAYVDRYDILMPHPMTYQCLVGGPEGFVSEACGGGSNVISWVPGRDAPLQPGKYILVWWEPERLSAGAYPTPVQVSINMGYLEVREEAADAHRLTCPASLFTPHLLQQRVAGMEP
jgi:hypothetical protein